MGCGPTWEAMNFAGMQQLHQLWDESRKGGLPIIFNIMNNFYGMGGQTHGETMAFDVVARFGMGVNADAMHAERVDGYNPAGGCRCSAAQAGRCSSPGEGSVMLETLTYRISGHSPSDASSYRDKDEIEAWQNADAIEAYAAEPERSGPDQC